MNKRVLPVGFILMAFVSGPGVWAQTTDASGDHTAPSYDMKAQSLVDLERVQKKFVDLANALPADKMTWRPSTDSRSFAELFLHVAGERYAILKLMGAAAPEGSTREPSKKPPPIKPRSLMN